MNKITNLHFWKLTNSGIVNNTTLTNRPVFKSSIVLYCKKDELGNPENYIGIATEDLKLLSVVEGLAGTSPEVTNIELPDVGYWATVKNSHKEVKAANIWGSCKQPNSSEEAMITVFIPIKGSHDWVARAWGFSSVDSKNAKEAVFDSACEVLGSKYPKIKEISKADYNTKCFGSLGVGVGSVLFAINTLSSIGNGLFGLDNPILVTIGALLIGVPLSLYGFFTYWISPLRRRFCDIFRSKSTPATLIRSMKRRRGIRIIGRIKKGKGFGDWLTNRMRDQKSTSTFAINADAIKKWSKIVP